MSTSRFVIGDVFDGLAALKAEGTQVDLVLTSPPFLALRSYLPPDHPDKGKEIGAEPTPAAFLSTMLDVVEACAEVLTPTGTLAFEFGDTYAGSGGGGGDYNPGGLREGQQVFSGSASRARHDESCDLDVDCSCDDLSTRMRDSNAAHWRQKNAHRDAWPMDKSLCMIPELFAASLAYGRNLLDPERTTDPWRIRNTIAWVRPNPPVGALGDKFRPAKSLITVAAKARDRRFDLDAVRTAAVRPDEAWAGQVPHDAATGRDGGTGQQNPAGAPPLDWWKISPGGWSGAHFAVWPPELLHRPIEAMCPRRVCRTCGSPSRRVVDLASHGDWARPEIAHTKANHGGPGTHGDRARDATTTGWSTCGCPATDGIRLDGYHTGTGWRPGIVLDPFGGSGTTGLVANGLSRDAILLDLDERNADLARERLGMFMTVEHAARESAA